MMTLLIISNNPNRPSFRQRIEIYLPALRSAGINCQVAKLPSGELARLRLFKKAQNFDGVFLQKKCLNFFDAILLRKYSKKIIYDLDDAIMYSPHYPVADKTSHFRLFRRTAKLADTIIAGNKYLAGHAKKFNSNVHILPTGLDTNEYDIDMQPVIDGKICLVWIGSKSTLKYLKDITPALEEIGSRFDNVVLRVICDRFLDLENMQVEKIHWSLQSQVKSLATADIGLAPLPDNRFTRGKCGFKILQYQAAHLPIITSPVGVNSDFVCDDSTGLLAGNITKWVEKLTHLIECPDLRKQMADAAKTHIKKFDSDVIGAKLCELIGESIRGNLDTASDNNTPKVSICISTYNRKDYLKETIDSILAQTYKNYEIVIVDDGSTDGTAEMIKNLDCPVSYHWQENKGDAAARNRLIQLAKGDYISFIDSDDLLMPDAVERMVHAMQTETENVVVYGSYYRIDQDSKVYGKCKRKLRSGNITKYLFETILVHSCGSMFPRKIFREVSPFDTKLKVCSDYDLWLRLSKEYRFVALDQPTFKRRRHLGNLSVPSLENCLTEFKVLERFYYEKGGKEVVPEKTAMKVFSKEGRRAGRYAIGEGSYDQACKLLGQSFRQHPNLKSLMSWIKAIILKKFHQIPKT